MSITTLVKDVNGVTDVGMLLGSFDSIRITRNEPNKIDKSTFEVNLFNAVVSQAFSGCSNCSVSNTKSKINPEN